MKKAHLSTRAREARLPSADRAYMLSPWRGLRRYSASSSIHYATVSAPVEYPGSPTTPACMLTDLGPYPIGSQRLNSSGCGTSG